MTQNTGNYRICKQIIGQGQTRTVLFSFNSKDDTITKFNSLNKESNWEYYCEEKVIYKETHRDVKGNHIDSTPSWRHFGE